MPSQAEIKEAFELFDANNSGTLSHDELVTVLRALGFNPTNAEAKELINKYDANNTGKLSLEEFTKLVESEKFKELPSEDDLANAFKVFDKDGSGFITKDELKKAMTSKGEPMTDAEVDKMMANVDADGDGKISYKEFAKKMLGAALAPAENNNNNEGDAAAAAPVEKESVRSKINWDELREKMPTEKGNADQKAKRKEMFRNFDPNGNGYLSLAECDKGVRDVLQLDEIFDVKPVIMRAFQAAKGVGNKKGRESKYGPDYVEFREFRLFLFYLRAYFEIWQMFDEVDSGDDNRVNLEEFKAALGKIASWGLTVDDAEAEFKSIDTNGGGQILFNEFAHWALAKKLDLEDDDEEESNE